MAARPTPERIAVSARVGAVRARQGALILGGGAILGGLTVFHPGLGLLAAALSVLLVVALRDLSWVIAGALFASLVGIPYAWAHARISVGGLDLYSNDFLVLILGFGLLFRVLLSGTVPTRPRDPIVVVLVVFLAYGVFTLGRSLGIWGMAAFSGFRVQFLYGAIFLAALPFLRERRARRSLAIAVLAAAAVIAVQGIWNLATGQHVGSTTGSRTFRYLSGLQATGLFFGLALLAAIAWSRRPPVWSIALGTLYTLGILISQARSVWLGGALGVGVAILISPGWSRKLGRLVVVAVTVTALVVVATVMTGGYSSGIVVRAQSLGQVSSDMTAVWRLFVWSVALEDLRSSPILGLGLGRQFVYWDAMQNMWESNRQLHNSYLELAYFAGAVGLALLLAFQVLVFVRTAAAARRAAGTRREALLLALIAAQVCLAGVAATNVVSASMAATTWMWILSAASVTEADDSGT